MHTVDTIMSKISKLRVHIAPVGFEVDRIVLPAKKMKADKVWLLIHDDPTKDKAKFYVEKITKELEKEDIDVKIAKSDRNNVFKFLKSVKELIQNEEKNDVYVNVSTGSKIQAIACMMACMLFNDRNNVIPFYAEPESYPATQGKQQSSGLRDLIELPKYEIQKPKRELIAALKIIRDHGGKITKKEMAKIADEMKIIIVKAHEENYEQARFASLDKNIIQPLADSWKFVEIEKIGRNRWIKITQEGLNAAEFLI